MKREKHIAAILLALSLVLSLVPVQALAADHPFTDVPKDAWYVEAVQYVYDRSLMVGSGSTTTFLPDGLFSRAQLVTILHRMEGTPSAKGMDFADVPAGQWYTDAVAWASANSIINGDGVNFRPNNTITHEQMAAILYRYAKFKGYSTAAMGDLAAFPGGDRVSAYAIENMNWATGAGLFEDVGGELSPSGGVNRAQAAMILTHFCRDAAVSYPMTVVGVVDRSCQPQGILCLDGGAFLVTDAAGGAIRRVEGSSSRTLASGLERPWVVAAYGNGYAVSEPDSGAVRLVGASGAVSKLDVTFQYPTGLASDEDGNLYVADTYAGTVQKITSSGTSSVFVKDLTDPMGLCWKDGALYIAETGANRIVKTTGGGVTVVAGSGEDGFADGSADKAAFSGPQCVAAGDDGAVYVSDTANGAVRRIQNGAVCTLARRDVSDLETLIPAAPVGLAVNGNKLYVCEGFGRAVFVISLAQ